MRRGGARRRGRLNGSAPAKAQVGDVWRHRWYQTSTKKTTLYLEAALKEAVEREARRRGLAEAQVIREAIAAAVTRPAPRAGLFDDRELVAARAEELLEGFGAR